MNEPPPPSYDDAITGNFSPTPSEPPPPPSSSPPVSVTTSFLGPETYKAPESIVPFTSPPLPAATSLPPSPGQQRENQPSSPRQSFFRSEQVRDRDMQRENQPSSPRLSHFSSEQNRAYLENVSSDERKGKVVKVACFIVVVLVGLGIIYFVLYF